MHMTSLDRLVQRELSRPVKLEEHTRKGQALGIGAEDHARLAHLFLKARVDSRTFRGLTGDALAARIRDEWRARVQGASAAAQGNA